MPSTINGIGTHYYGKKNIDERAATCQHCGHHGMLSSYDTRLWFVIIFIPIIPLGRKRIIEYCPACTRHFMMELDKWEAAKQLEISGAMERFRSTPTPELGIEAHQQLLKFHQYTQAESFRQTLREKFYDNAKVQLHLGYACAHLSQFKQAEAAFERALELRPDMPEAKVGVAESHIRAGRLTEARRLLDYLESPGAEQLYSMEPLEYLANTYYTRGSHKEALELFQRLLVAIPAAAEHDGFRKKVKACEKALGKTESILPKSKFNWRKLFKSQPVAAGAGSGISWRGVTIFAIIAFVILIGALIGNEHVRRNRTLHIIASTPGQITVQVDDLPAVTMHSGLQEITLAEGKHHAHITGSITQDLDFEVKSSYMDRWFADPVWVLNPGGSAVLLFERAVYSKNPPPADYSFHFGESFFWFPEVTHPFKELPRSLSMKSYETKTLTHIELLNEAPYGLFDHLVEEKKFDAASKLAESRLRQWPEDKEMLDDYYRLALRNKQKERFKKFLAEGLDRRPILIPWHRLYQSLDQNAQREVMLAVEYDKQLAKEPNNSALLYLRGRVAVGREESSQWFQRAVEADDRNAYANYALAYNHLYRADWAGARQYLAKVVKLEPENEEFATAFFQCRLALGEFAELEAEARKQVAGPKATFMTHYRLMELLTVQNRIKDAESIMTGYVNSVQSKSPEAARKIERILKNYLFYAAGDFAMMERLAKADKTGLSKTALFQALAEQGKMNEALKAYPAEAEEEHDAIDYLATSLACFQANDLAEATVWRVKAIEQLKKGSEEEILAARILGGEVTPQFATIDDIGMTPERKSIFLAAVGLQHPVLKNELFALARKLNIGRSYPYHLVARTVAER
jgi:tetratricopeptide (TPR) repeat protein